MEDKIKRWVQNIGGIPSLGLPTDYPRPSQQKFVESIESFNLDKPLNKSQLLSIYLILLFRYTGDSSILLGFNIDDEPTLSKFEFEPNSSFNHLENIVNNVLNEAENDLVPFELISNELLKHNQSNDRSLFKVSFSTSSNQRIQSALSSEISLYYDEQSNNSIKIIYNALLFSNQRIQNIISQFKLLASNIGNIDNIGSFSLFTKIQSQILPNPRSDLDWCGFKGAITDIFSENAKSEPERTCIVESTECGDKRTWSYKEINEASNVLAHCLLDNGIQREEVVMVYAYRGVDLVVAVMGVLKAGATFSVIG